jgi:hypothetical protein
MSKSILIGFGIGSLVTACIAAYIYKHKCVCDNTGSLDTYNETTKDFVENRKVVEPKTDSELKDAFDGTKKQRCPSSQRIINEAVYDTTHKEEKLSVDKLFSDDSSNYF